MNDTSPSAQDKISSRRIVLRWVSFLPAVLIVLAGFTYNMQIIRWFYLIASPKVIWIGNKKVELPKGFFIDRRSNAPREYFVGGFHDDKAIFSTESYLYVTRPDNFERFALNRIRQNCLKECTSFSTQDIGGAQCAVQHRQDGWAEKAQVLNIFCTFPAIGTVVSYHGTENDYPYFAAALEKLARVGGESRAAS